MQAFKKISGVMAYLPTPNIDTDVIIPKQYLKTIKRTGLGAYLFAELRYDNAGNPKPEFILNQPEFQTTKVLLVEDNFGCGSSREHAVWSLLDFVIQAIIAPSFADIFYSNCFKNGLLPIIVSKEVIHQLASLKSTSVIIDLKAQEIRSGAFQWVFTIDPYHLDLLLKGLDEIGETLTYDKEITAFEACQRREKPWLY